MSEIASTSPTLSEKVAAILATSSLQPGIREIYELMKVAAVTQQMDTTYAGFYPPAPVSQVANLQA